MLADAAHINLDIVPLQATGAVANTQAAFTNPAQAKEDSAGLSAASKSVLQPRAVAKATEADLDRCDKASDTSQSVKGCCQAVTGPIGRAVIADCIQCHTRGFGATLACGSQLLTPCWVSRLLPLGTCPAQPATQATSSTSTTSANAPGRFGASMLHEAATPAAIPEGPSLRSNSAANNGHAADKTTQPELLSHGRPSSKAGHILTGGLDGRSVTRVGHSALIN